MTEQMSNALHNVHNSFRNASIAELSLLFDYGPGFHQDRSQQNFFREK